MRNFNPLTQILDTIGGTLSIFENKVPMQTQMEYFQYSNRLRSKTPEMQDADYMLYEMELGSQGVSRAKKKKLLTVLALTRQVKAYRVLEDYLTHPDEGLADWAEMALMECRMALESELSDERHIYISTGMGGKDGKLRYYGLLTHANGARWEDYQRQLIEKEFPYIFGRYDCEIEQLTFGNIYCEILMLSPVQCNLQAVIDVAIKECNEYGNFLNANYLVTNVRKPTPEELKKLIANYKKTLHF
jgi:hypothetical protein